MASLRDLVRMSTEELWQAHTRNQIPSQIRNRPSQDAATALSHEGFYHDYGNYAGSLVMFMLLFPGDFLNPNEASLSVLPLVNGAGDREEVLREVGKPIQKSGTGQHNYRTNLLEAIIGALGEDAKYTQLLWECVCIRCIEDEESWVLPQRDFIRRIIDDYSHVSNGVLQLASLRTCTELNIDPYNYYPLVKKIGEILETGRGATAFPDYSSIMTLTGCSKNASRQLWEAIPVLQDRLHQESNGEPRDCSSDTYSSCNVQAMD